MSDEIKKKNTVPAEDAKQAPEISKDELNKVVGGAFNGFTNLGDIKGESTDKDHKDW
jgi:bacteriocin-like protein